MDHGKINRYISNVNKIFSILPKEFTKQDIAEHAIPLGYAENSAKTNLSCRLIDVFLEKNAIELITKRGRTHNAIYRKVVKELNYEGKTESLNPSNYVLKNLDLDVISYKAMILEDAIIEIGGYRISGTISIKKL